MFTHCHRCYECLMLVSVCLLLSGFNPMNHISKICVRYIVCDLLTTMTTYRPHKLNAHVEIDAECDCLVPNTKIWSLHWVCLGETEPIKNYVQFCFCWFIGLVGRRHVCIRSTDKYYFGHNTINNVCGINVRCNSSRLALS